VLGTIDPYPWPPRGHVLPGPVGAQPAAAAVLSSAKAMSA
jgi:hypothetical protein